jgi:hypothetical protein
MCHSNPSPLDTLAATFRLLVDGPQPIALDGFAVGMRAGPVRLPDLQAILFHPATSVDVQRAALVELVRLARRRRGPWVVGLAGVLLPGLKETAARGTMAQTGSNAHLGEALLAELLAQLNAPDSSDEGVAEVLLSKVVRRPSRRQWASSARRGSVAPAGSLTVVTTGQTTSYRPRPARTPRAAGSGSL